MLVASIATSTFISCFIFTLAELVVYVRAVTDSLRLSQGRGPSFSFFGDNVPKG